MVLEVGGDKEIILNNNCSVNVGDPGEESEPVYVTCPKLEDDNVYLNTNSSFSKVEKVVDYKWPKTRNVTWLTVHRSKPYIAYVIQPEFNEITRRSKTFEDMDPTRQCIRIHNYHNQKRGLVKPGFSAIIGELAFAYISMSVRSENRLAIIDRLANVQIYEFNCPDDEGSGLTTIKLLEIVSEVNTPFSEVRITWCPGYIIDDEDLGMNLAISYDNCIEIYDVGQIIDRGIGHLSKEDLAPSAPERKIIKGSENQPIITISLSNDMSMICAASMDNRVRFYQIDTDEVRLVHTWEPKMRPNAQLSCIFFLDDFNELLKDQESGIWGHILVGTSDGEITIWESNSWKPIQKIVLNCQDDEPAKIEYRIDVTSHVIIANHGKTAFLLMLEFLDVDNAKDSHKADSAYDESDLANDLTKGLMIKQPRIKKITRFQLYNPILSFSIKRPSPLETEIFWLTQKSLEKCLIDNESLIVEENPESSFLARFNLSNIGKDFDHKRSLYPSMGINGDDDKNSPRISLKTFDDTPPVTLAEMFTNIGTITESGTSGLSSAANPSSDLKSIANYSLIDDDINQRPPTPASREVANYLDDEGDISRTPSGQIIDNIARYNAHSDLNVPAKILNIDPRAQTSSVPYEPLPKDLATENMLKSLEAKLLAHVDGKVDGIKSEMSRISCDISNLRSEVKDPSQFKASNKIIDALIKKLMYQINQTFAKGLDEFIGQIKMEISSTSNIISQSRTEFNSHCTSVEKQFKQYENQMADLRKQMAECAKQQNDILAQLRFQQQHLQGSISPSPNLRNSQLMTNPSFTPTPLKQQIPFSPMVIFQSEEEKRKKAEAERRARLQLMWSKIKSNERQSVIEGISQAFEMKDQSLINDICEYFRTTKSASHLVELIGHDQALLLSLLSTLASSDLKEEKWKIPFITSIVPQLDIDSPIVKDWLPRFETKLIGRLEEARKALGGQAHDIPLVLRILTLYRGRSA